MPLSPEWFIEKVMQEFQKELKEFTDKMYQLQHGLVIVVTENMQWKETQISNGLAKHSQEIEIFILSKNIDILLVSEMHFTNKNYLYIPGYILYHTMHPDAKAHSRIALIIRSSIKYYEINKYQRDFLQTTSVMVETWNGCITISVVYSPRKRVNNI